MGRKLAVVVSLSFCLSLSQLAHAQSRTGWYVGGSVGAGLPSTSDAERVLFDTNLDGGFGDTVRTAAGVDAFSPGFCAGLAVNAMAASGCTDDENGIDFGGRVGYDASVGRLIIGALVDVFNTDFRDSVTAFSTTPAFYAFTREVNVVAGLRGRVGFGSDRLLVYGTGGGALGSVEETFTTSNVVNTFTRPQKESVGSTSSRVWGYQAGAGIEVAIGGGLQLAGEYLFTQLDDRNEFTVRSGPPAPATNPFILINPQGTDLQPSDALRFQAVRFGVNYRF
jgi:outer membrane immunogenic protein